MTIHDIENIKKYQVAAKDHQILQGYCKNIREALESPPEHCEERALWELVQNARDLVDENCHINIRLEKDKLVFSHYGPPFDYTSLLALVHQSSSKDEANAEIAGRYGTGFMTTHCFNETVVISAPFAVKSSQKDISHYVRIKNFRLDRSHWRNLEEGIKEMREEIDLVDKLSESDDVINEDEAIIIPTTFSYELDSTKSEIISTKLRKTIKLIPLVLAINPQIITIEFETPEERIVFNRNNVSTEAEIGINGWRKFKDVITVTKDSLEEEITIHSLQSGDRSDVIIIPPYPTGYDNPSEIPSLFMWFPLLGTENFGVNFIFHSRHFYPIEKRNAILLPRDGYRDASYAASNGKKLEEMMEVLHSYYRNPANAATLSIDECKVAFLKKTEDEIEAKFFNTLQRKWSEEIRNWEIVPTKVGRHSVSAGIVKVLHPDFYSSLSDEKQKAYEDIMRTYAGLVKSENGETYLLPENNLIQWSKTVKQWECENDDIFYLTLQQVCESIKNKPNNLLDFLLFIKEIGKEQLFNAHPLIPNREGRLNYLTSLLHAGFMTEKLYNIVKPLMGRTADKIIDPTYLEVSKPGDFTIAELKDAISSTVSSWRDNSINSPMKRMPSEEQISALIEFCSMFPQREPSNFRYFLLSCILPLFDKSFNLHLVDKLMGDRDEEFYRTPFNLLVDATLLFISTKPPGWVKENEKALFAFLRAYTSGNNKDRLEKLDTFGVIPTQNYGLRKHSQLHNNCGVPEEMEKLYASVFNEELKDRWIAEPIRDIVETIADTPSQIGDDLERKMYDDFMSEKPSDYTKQLKEIILLCCRDGSPWRMWCKQIYEKRESITFKMQTGTAQKSLFTLMDLSEEELGKLAEIQKENGIQKMLMTYEDRCRLEMVQTARFQHLHAIGKSVEKAIRDRIDDSFIDIIWSGKDGDDSILSDDEQNGQDIIVRIKHGDKIKDVYYIEVKSKWNFDDPAHMSQAQIRKACLNPEKYALCCVYLKPHLHKNSDGSHDIESLAKLPQETIISSTKVKTDIGYTLRPLFDRIIEADKQPDEKQIKISDYRSNMWTEVFTQGEPFENLIERIINAIKGMDKESEVLSPN